MVAQEQRQWPQAERYYQHALQIYIDFNDRYSQAGTYHQLGSVAQEQRQWAQAERYYKDALQIKIEFNDRYSQASTYHQLGMVAQEQRQWPRRNATTSKPCRSTSTSTTATSRPPPCTSWVCWPRNRNSGRALDYLIQAAAIFAAYQDANLAITLRSLARLRGRAPGLPVAARLAQALSITEAEAEQLLDAAASGGGADADENEDRSAFDAARGQDEPDEPDEPDADADAPATPAGPTPPPHQPRPDARGQEEGVSLAQLLDWVERARRGDHALGGQLFAALQQMMADPGAPDGAARTGGRAAQHSDRRRRRGPVRPSRGGAPGRAGAAGPAQRGGVRAYRARRA